MDELRTRYEGGATIRELQAEYQISYWAMRQALLDAGVPLRSKGRRKGWDYGTTRPRSDAGTPPPAAEHDVAAELATYFGSTP